MALQYLTTGSAFCTVGCDATGQLVIKPSDCETIEEAIRDIKEAFAFEELLTTRIRLLDYGRHPQRLLAVYILDGSDTPALLVFTPGPHVPRAQPEPTGDTHNALFAPLE